jgi:hypothetical protein
MDQTHIMVVSEVALMRGEGHGVDGGGKLRKEAWFRRTIGEPCRFQRSKVNQCPVAYVGERASIHIPCSSAR